MSGGESHSDQAHSSTNSSVYVRARLYSSSCRFLRRRKSSAVIKAGFAPPPPNVRRRRGAGFDADAWFCEAEGAALVLPAPAEARA